MKVEKVSIDEEEDDGGGPRKILVKKYGGNIFDNQAKQVLRINPPMIQSLIFYENSRCGWGPELYGLFEEGRVEEFVECHTLTGEEAFTPEMSRETARAFARFHSLNVPIAHEHYDTLARTLTFVKEGKNQLRNFLNNGHLGQSQSLRCFEKLYEFPIEEEAAWVNSIRPKIEQRTVLCTLDPNYLNRLVRNEKPKDADAPRVLLIDFDITAYSDRGYDLGGHFINRMFDARATETFFTGLPYPSELEQRTFLSFYLEEWKKLHDDPDTSGLDSMDNLMLECDLNALVYLLVMLVLSLTMFSIVDKKPQVVTFIDPVMPLYKDLKKKFCAKYPHLADN